jgi:hypothetical protein
LIDTLDRAHRRRVAMIEPCRMMVWEFSLRRDGLHVCSMRERAHRAADREPRLAISVAAALT